MGSRGLEVTVTVCTNLWQPISKELVVEMILFFVKNHDLGSSDRKYERVHIYHSNIILRCKLDVVGVSDWINALELHPQCSTV